MYYKIPVIDDCLSLQKDLDRVVVKQRWSHIRKFNFDYKIDGELSSIILSTMTAQLRFWIANYKLD